MPIRPYLEGTTFDPEAIRVMIAAYEDVCRTLEPRQSKRYFYRDRGEANYRDRQAWGARSRHNAEIGIDTNRHTQVQVVLVL
jgi:hypothetical protein